MSPFSGLAVAGLLALALLSPAPPALGQTAPADKVERRTDDTVDVWADMVAGLGAARDALAHAGGRFEQFSKLRDRRYGEVAGSRLKGLLDALVARTDRQADGRAGPGDPLLGYLRAASDENWERAVGHVAIVLMNTLATLDDVRAVDPAMVPERPYRILNSLARGSDLMAHLVGGLARPKVAEELNLFMAARDRYVDWLQELYYMDSAVGIYLAAIRR
ncbi:MAG: hypothetical protein EXQ87_02800 [Alphaproteobacteria bacterium]|nr:hypothetical protein [Alphaproteobacteria bacterium]